MSCAEQYIPDLGAQQLHTWVAAHIQGAREWVVVDGRRGTSIPARHGHMGNFPWHGSLNERQGQKSDDTE